MTTNKVELYKLVNYLAKADLKAAEQLAKDNPDLLTESMQSYGYNTPLCIAADKKLYDLVLLFAQINPQAIEARCGSNPVLLYVTSRHRDDNYNFAFNLAQLNKKAVSSEVINLLSRREEYKHAIEFSKLNPIALEEFNYDGTPIENAIHSGYTEFADDLIGVLDAHYAQSKADSSEL